MMVGKLEAGGIWGSNFILPEHRKALIRQQRDELCKSKPLLDDQELESIQKVLNESFHHHKPICLRLFGEFGEVSVQGIVTIVQLYSEEIRLATGQDDWQWIRIEDILAAE